MCFGLLFSFPLAGYEFLLTLYLTILPLGTVFPLLTLLGSSARAHVKPHKAFTWFYLLRAEERKMGGLRPAPHLQGMWGLGFRVSPWLFKGIT